ncbi:MAG: hypothetical protein GX542_13845 [Rhodococcus sp.]|nr:hypothetical protein [Rhodococcus sp. (in: high G+C Gram-positive bacteria)]
MLAFDDVVALHTDDTQYRTHSAFETAASEMLWQLRDFVDRDRAALDNWSLEGIELIADRISHTINSFVAPGLGRTAAACQAITVVHAHSLVDGVQRPYLGALAIAATARHCGDAEHTLTRAMGLLAARWEAFPALRGECETQIVDCADNYLRRVMRVAE